MSAKQSIANVGVPSFWRVLRYFSEMLLPRDDTGFSCALSHSQKGNLAACETGSFIFYSSKFI